MALYNAGNAISSHIMNILIVRDQDFERFCIPHGGTAE